VFGGHGAEPVEVAHRVHGLVRREVVGSVRLGKHCGERLLRGRLRAEPTLQTLTPLAIWTCGQIDGVAPRSTTTRVALEDPTLQSAPLGERCGDRIAG